MLHTHVQHEITPTKTNGVEEELGETSGLKKKLSSVLLCWSLREAQSKQWPQTRTQWTVGPHPPWSFLCTRNNFSRSWVKTMELNSFQVISVPRGWRGRDKDLTMLHFVLTLFFHTVLRPLRPFHGFLYIFSGWLYFGQGPGSSGFRTTEHREPWRRALLSGLQCLRNLHYSALTIGQNTHSSKIFIRISIKIWGKRSSISNGHSFKKGIYSTNLTDLYLYVNI